jgi:hypothetical protein
VVGSSGNDVTEMSRIPSTRQQGKQFHAADSGLVDVSLGSRGRSLGGGCGVDAGLLTS